MKILIKYLNIKKKKKNTELSKVEKSGTIRGVIIATIEQAGINNFYLNFKINLFL